MLLPLAAAPIPRPAALRKRRLRSPRAPAPPYAALRFAARSPSRRRRASAPLPLPSPSPYPDTPLFALAVAAPLADSIHGPPSALWVLVRQREAGEGERGHVGVVVDDLHLLRLDPLVLERYRQQGGAVRGALYS